MSSGIVLFFFWRAKWECSIDTHAEAEDHESRSIVDWDAIFVGASFACTVTLLLRFLEGRAKSQLILRMRSC
jgi:hypothetical protein